MKSLSIKISCLTFAVFISSHLWGATGNPFIVTNGNDDGTLGTLRYALDSANNTPGSNTITFNYSGMITLTSALPSITDTLIIDGTSAPGYTNFPMISIMGTSSVSAGMIIVGSGASNTIIKGLHIADSSASGIGIQINTADNVVITGCYFFTDYTSPNHDSFLNSGTNNTLYGIYIINCSGHTIGGATVDSANIIHTQYPIFHQNVTNIKIRGNYLVTSKTGDMPAGTLIPPYNTGISFFSVSNAIVEENVIGNCYTAINFSNTTNNNIIRNNYIGTNASKSSIVSNGTGIHIYSGSNNTISSNIIAYSTANVGSGAAVELDVNCDYNLITQNDFFGNVGGGIVGAGNQSYSPASFTGAPYAISGGSATITGTSGAYDMIEIFIADTSGAAIQGDQFKINVQADPGGIWAVSVPFSSAAKITTTATNTFNNNTSVFSVLADVFDCSAISADAGPDTTICTGNNFYLNGIVKNATQIIWTSSGTGTFADSSVYNTYYYPSSADTAAGSVYITLKTLPGTCAASVMDSFLLSFTGTRIADAGPSYQTLCSTNTEVQLAGILYNTSVGKWSGGNGTFKNGNDSIPNAIYIPAGFDFSPDGFNLYFTPVGSGGTCSDISDNINYNWENPETVSGSPLSGNTPICKDSLGLTATLSKNISTATWSSSLNKGRFYPDAIVPAQGSPYNYYTPAPEDYAAGSIYLVLTGSVGGTSACPMPKDSFLLTLIPPATVFAGNDTTVCSLSPIVFQHAMVTGTTSFKWTTTGAGGFLPLDTTLTATYHPNAGGEADSIYIILSTTQGCVIVTDSLLVHFVTAPTFYAGIDKSGCQQDSVKLTDASISANAPFRWSTNGSGTFSPNAATLHAAYIPSAADTQASGTLFLILSDSSGTAVCSVTPDTLTLTLSTPPVIFAGNDTTVCTLSPILLKHATVSGTTSFKWTTTGAGGFLPFDTSLTTTYYPNPGGEANSVYIKLSTLTGCGITSDTILVNFVTAPVSNAGSDKLGCPGDSIKLTGASVSASVPFIWSTNGSGTFSPNATTLNATYIRSQADMRRVVIGLTLTAALPNCLVTKDELLVITLPLPDAGSQGGKQLLCPETSITLNALTPGPDQVGKWVLVKGSGVIASPGQASTAVDNISADENTYQWTVTDTSTGCTNSTFYIVDHCFQPEVTVYNVVSPNNDGMNEFLEIENIENYTSNKVVIYNRSGDVVFQMDDYNNVDRVFKGKSNIGPTRDLLDGVYYYQISKGNGGKAQKGFLVLKNDK